MTPPTPTNCMQVSTWAMPLYSLLPAVTELAAEKVRAASCQLLLLGVCLGRGGN